MASYNGPARNRVNMHSFIDDLNRLPTSQDYQASAADGQFVGGADELSLWTNADFSTDFSLEPIQIGEFGYGGEQGQTIPPAVPEYKSSDFENADFAFDVSYPQTPGPTFAERPSQTHGLSSIQSTLYSELPSAISPPAETPATGEKRKAVDSPENYEDASRIAAEEDKRRRNTAASARFRVKKKQREIALERSAKDMADKVAAFESRIATLETENKWLRSLITEKNEKDLDLPALWKKYTAEESTRRGSERKDGVGTKA
ncbi:hypothetical protein BJ878DRAFT_14967 [Calycina marina]|uniref:BZIP domain-containing protein n=1 Tax=Calycina marina TaxID=1763456 RepID=A0A9P8CFS3_9HELO|nr:hypothetical protein BJ878DRAFT_14967 [Calycina marina]